MTLLIYLKDKTIVMTMIVHLINKKSPEDLITPIQWF